jgi:PKD repeat protein
MVPLRVAKFVLFVVVLAVFLFLGKVFLHPFLLSAQAQSGITGAATSIDAQAEQINVPQVVIIEITNSSPTVLGQPTIFKATISGNPKNYIFTWNFGDGTQALQGNPIPHTYATTGVYIAEVLVSNKNDKNDNGRASTRVEITQAPTPTPTPTPKPPFGLTPESNSPTDAHQVTHFIAHLVEGGSSNLKFTWDFGDGSGPVEGVAPDHTYHIPQDTPYKVKVTATDNINGNNYLLSANLDVLIRDEPIDSPFFTVSGPVMAGVPAKFTGHAQKGTRITYTWLFGDGSSPVTTFEDAVITHTYVYNDGIPYTVQLIGQNSRNTGDSSGSLLVQPSAPEVIDDISDNSPQPLGKDTIFTIRIKTDIDAATIWDFGDGQSYTQPVPKGNAEQIVVKHQYQTAGKFPVILWISNRSGSQMRKLIAYVDVSKPAQQFAISSVPPMPVAGLLTAFTA